MKLVIDISDEIYESIHKAFVLTGFERVIRDGKPLDSVLDEIRAEIETNTEKWWCGKSACFLKQVDVLDIIDKYK